MNRLARKRSITSFLQLRQLREGHFRRLASASLGQHDQGVGQPFDARIRDELRGIDEIGSQRDY